MTDTVSSRKFKTLLNEYVKNSNILTNELNTEIPSSWERYGDCIIFPRHSFLSSVWAELGSNFWEYICQILKVRRIGIKGRINNDDFRSPRTTIVYGPKGIVSFVDNGIRYSWDVERCMFSRGNAVERHRIGKLSCEGEVIVDLFAGIGYFTLPYLVHAKAKLVHACEWNEYALQALRKNLDLNNVTDRCIIHPGDNRKANLKNIGDRVNVGLIPSSEDYWFTACEALLSSGGVLYIHENVTSAIGVPCLECSECLVIRESLCAEFRGTYQPVKVSFNTVKLEENVNAINWKKSEWFYFSLHLSHILLDYLKKIFNSSWTVSVREYFKIKSYAPHIDHIVFSVYCSPDS